MRMNFRNARIGLAVAFSIIGLAILAVGGDPSVAEQQIICYPALAVGFVVMTLLEARDQRRGRRR
jgi:hypothetical protein